MLYMQCMTHLSHLVFSLRLFLGVGERAGGDELFLWQPKGTQISVNGLERGLQRQSKSCSQDTHPQHPRLSCLALPPGWPPRGSGILPWPLSTVAHTLLTGWDTRVACSPNFPALPCTCAGTAVASSFTPAACTGDPGALGPGHPSYNRATSSPNIQRGQPSSTRSGRWPLVETIVTLP